MLSSSSFANLAAPFVVASVVTFVAIRFLLPNAERLGFIDHPDGKRKIHTTGKPVVGGLGMLAVELIRPGSGFSVAPAATLLVIAVPVADTLVVMLKRIIARKHPFHPDRNHVHHVLQAMGFGHRGSVLVIAVLTIASAGIAVTGTLLHIPDTVLFDIWAGGFFLYALASYNVKPMHRMVYSLRRKLASSRQGQDSRPKTSREPIPADMTL